MIPRGFLPVLFYSLASVAVPVLYLYSRCTLSGDTSTDPGSGFDNMTALVCDTDALIDIDYSDDMVRGVVIGLSVIAALALVYANDCCAWYNMLLFFHIGIEAKVVDVVFTEAFKDDTTDLAAGLYIFGACVVIVHLIPFLLTDHLMFLSLLAAAGVVANATLLVFASPDLLLLASLSATTLLAMTMLIRGVCEIRISLFSLFMDAMKKGKYVECDGFEL